MTSPTSTILIVGTASDSLKMLAQVLQDGGSRVRFAADGRSALESARAETPTLIVLEAALPEVGEQLRADDRIRDVPILFIGAENNSLIEAEREQRKIVEEHNKELEAFAHTVAHDLKTPLADLMGYSEILFDMASVIQNHTVLEAVAGVKRSAQRGLNIIRELLVLASSRRQTVQLQAVDMVRVVENARQRLEMMIADYHAEIIVPAEMPTAMGYASWLEEVWVNYLSNGIKYGGKPPRLEVGAMPQGDGTIRFWVRDNGDGISAEDRATLFTEFTRLTEVHVKGNGLGLSIVKRIVERLGGQVGVESEGATGRGSEFYFTLLKPLHADDDDLR